MKLFKKTAVEVVGYNPYTEFVLGGWDYTINNKQSAEKKSKAIVKVCSPQGGPGSIGPLKSSNMSEGGIGRTLHFPM